MAEVVKSRFFDFLVYPESAPKDWMGELRRSPGQYAISPLHAPDDEVTKEHYHGMFYCGNGPITLKAAKQKIPAEVPANGYVEVTGSSTGYMRYLIHLDDPEKEQFPGGENSITLINGFPLDLTRELTKAEKAAIRSQLVALIRDNGVIEYSDFIFGLEDMGDPDLADYAATHTIFFSKLIDSQRHKGKQSAIDEFKRKAEAMKETERKDAEEQERIDAGLPRYGEVEGDDGNEG